MGTGNSGRYSHTGGARERSDSEGRVKAIFFLPGKLETHYDDHIYEFREAMTPEEYEERARVFFDKPITKDIVWAEDFEGVLYKYDKEKNEFGMCRSEGAIITYFRPKNGIVYWHNKLVENELQEMRLLR